MDEVDVVLIKDAQRIGQCSAALVVVQREDEASIHGTVGSVLNVGSGTGQFGLSKEINEYRTCILCTPCGKITIFGRKYQLKSLLLREKIKKKQKKKNYSCQKGDFIHQKLI